MTMEVWTVESIDLTGRWIVGQYDNIEDALTCAHAHLEHQSVTVIQALTTIIAKEPF